MLKVAQEVAALQQTFYEESSRLEITLGHIRDDNDELDAVPCALQSQTILHHKTFRRRFVMRMYMVQQKNTLPKPKPQPHSGEAATTTRLVLQPSPAAQVVRSLKLGKNHNDLVAALENRTTLTTRHATAATKHESHYAVNSSRPSQAEAPLSFPSPIKVKGIPSTRLSRKDIVMHTS